MFRMSYFDSYWKTNAVRLLMSRYIMIYDLELFQWTSPRVAFPPISGHLLEQSVMAAIKHTSWIKHNKAGWSFNTLRIFYN